MTNAWRIGIVAIAITASCASSSGQGLPLLHRAIAAKTVRVLIEGLSATDAAATDAQKVCDGSPAMQDMWFDAIRLLNMPEAMRAYARCADEVNVDLIEATTLPLTGERRIRLERYIADWKPLPQRDVIDEIFGTPAGYGSPDWYTSLVSMALEADGSSEALVLCERLAAKIGPRCHADVFAGRRIFDTSEDAVAYDPFLTLYSAKLLAKSLDGMRRFYLLDTLKRPHDDTCRPIAVLVTQDGKWSLERVECETTSNLAAGS